MLQTMKEMLIKAQKGHYAVLAPSVAGHCSIDVAIRAAEKYRAPIILNINFKIFREEDLPFVIQYARARAMNASVPVAINLDHSKTYEQAVKAIHFGYTSIMVDRSDKPFEENVAQVAELVKVAHAVGVSVEAELGHVGRGDSADSFMYEESVMTDPSEAAEYVEKTGCDFLAVSIGNSHGVYSKGIPHIDFDRLEAIRKVVSVPLVLHGGSGTGDENLARACQSGICKVNVGTELRMAAAKNVQECDQALLHRDIYKHIEKGYEDEIIRHIKLFGSEGKADE